MTQYKRLTRSAIHEPQANTTKIVSMIRKLHNHKLQTNPWHHEEEPHNNHKTLGRQTKKNNQNSLPHLLALYALSISLSHFFSTLSFSTLSSLLALLLYSHSFSTRTPSLLSLLYSHSSLLALLLYSLFSTLSSLLALLLYSLFSTLSSLLALLLYSVFSTLSSLLSLLL